MNERWVQTYSGRKFTPLNPKIEDIDINDIATALSRKCRYNGHCREFYSVAEHSVLMARYAPKWLRLAALLHDAGECYLTDMPGPIKSAFSDFVACEDAIMELVAQKFGFMWPLPDEVKRMDRAMLSDEKEQIMAPTEHDWGLMAPALGIKLQLWTPKRARAEFLMTFYEAGGKP